MTERNLLKRIVVDPKIMLGKPVIKGTRLPVEIIVEKVAYGATIDDLRKDYPFLKGDDIRAALLYAAKRIANEDNLRSISSQFKVKAKAKGNGIQFI
jgi:uncharacterized protein (DUF433 family)